MVEFYSDNADENRWRILEGEGSEEIINKSTEGFSTSGGARNNLLVAYSLVSTYLVAVVQKSKFDAVDFYEDEDGKHRWRVTADNNEIVAAAHKGFGTEGAAKNNLLITYTMISTYLAMAAQ